MAVARLRRTSCEVKQGLGGRFAGYEAAGEPAPGRAGTDSGHDQATCSSLGSRTRLQGTAVSVHSRPTRSVLAAAGVAKPAVVLIQPKLSSIRLRRHRRN